MSLKIPYENHLVPKCTFSTHKKLEHFSFVPEFNFSKTLCGYTLLTGDHSRLSSKNLLTSPDFL